ncbi:AbrB/MazE/SpoVT family DNA-binding domain-containing protein [Actinokineospora sp. HUAS TT18]|uniref:AbrB/MazE/SpoVT family DNA-binding domain-containing protein n=1 Tax=Actinokineospora sp. HUAS TT18 TaxID=3447451 RepID=UPI003F51EE53
MATQHQDGEPARTTDVSSKNQVTLPVAALAAAHVQPGEVLRVEVEADGILRLVRHRDPFLDALNGLAGSAPGLAEATNLEEQRNEWDR